MGRHPKPFTKASFGRSAEHFRSTSMSGHVQFPSACLKGATRRLMDRRKSCETGRQTHSGNPALRKEAHCFSLTSGERMGPRYPFILEKLQLGWSRRTSAITRRASSILPAST
jgi:hypothetical protein